MRPENTCICCGEQIPEGRSICPICESVFDSNHNPVIITQDPNELQEAKEKIKTQKIEIRCLFFAVIILAAMLLRAVMVQ